MRRAVSGSPTRLACAARQHDPPSGLGRKARAFQPIAHEFENLLDPRLDDANEVRFRQMVRNVPFVLIDLRHRDHVPVIRARRDRGAVEA